MLKVGDEVRMLSSNPYGFRGMIGDTFIVSDLVGCASGSIRIDVEGGGCFLNDEGLYEIVSLKARLLRNLTAPPNKLRSLS